jgi:hypothetical protein
MLSFEFMLIKPIFLGIKSEKWSLSWKKKTDFNSSK